MNESYLMKPIAHIRTDFPAKFGVPRQAGLVGALTGTIVFEKEYRVDAALRVIDALTARGFRFVTVSELAALSGTPLQGGQAYYRFSFAKNDSISGRDAETEPCTKPGFPPPLPRSASFIARQSWRRSPSRVPMAY